MSWGQIFLNFQKEANKGNNKIKFFEPQPEVMRKFKTSCLWSWGIAIFLGLPIGLILIPYYPPKEAFWGLYILIFGTIFGLGKYINSKIVPLADLNEYAKETGTVDYTRKEQHKLIVMLPWWIYLVFGFVAQILKEIGG